MFMSLKQECVVYVHVVKEVALFRDAQALGQLMGMAHNRTCARALQTSRRKLLVALRRNWN